MENKTDNTIFEFSTNSTHPVFKFSQDSHFLLVCDGEGIRVFDTKKKKLVFQNIMKSYLYSDLNTYPAFSPDGKWVLVHDDVLAEGKHNYRFCVFETETGRLVKDISYQNGRIFSHWHPWSSDSTMIVLPENGNTAAVYELAADKKLYSVPAYKSYITSLTFSADGKYLLTSSLDGTALVTDIKKEETADQLVADGYKLLNAAFAGGTDKIIVSRAGGKESATSCQIWKRVTEKNQALTIPYSSGYAADKNVIFYPDGKKIFYNADVFDIETGDKIFSLEESGVNSGYGAFVFSHDGKLAAGESYLDEAAVWDTSNGRKLKVLKAGKFENPEYLQFSSDDKRLGFWWQFPEVAGGGYGLWDIYTGKMTARQKLGWTGTHIFDGNLSRLIYAHRDQTEHIISVINTQTVSKRYTINRSFYNLAFSPKEDILVVSYQDNRAIEVSDINTGSFVKKIDDGLASALSFSVDGNRLFIVYTDGRFKIYDINAGTFTYTESNADFTEGREPVKSKDGRIITGVKEVRNGFTGEVIARLKPDNNAYKYNRIAAISDDGRRIAVCEDTPRKSLRVYTIPTLQEAVDKLKEILLGRTMTPEEKNKYYIE